MVAAVGDASRVGDGDTIELMAPIGVDEADEEAVELDDDDDGVEPPPVI